MIKTNYLAWIENYQILAADVDTIWEKLLFEIDIFGQLRFHLIFIQNIYNYCKFKKFLATQVLGLHNLCTAGLMYSMILYETKLIAYCTMHHFFPFFATKIIDIWIDRTKMLLKTNSTTVTIRQQDT